MKLPQAVGGESAEVARQTRVTGGGGADGVVVIWLTFETLILR
jgi:hypothetical protein